MAVFWRNKFGEMVAAPNYVWGVPLNITTDCPPGRLYLLKGAFHVNPNDYWSLSDFQSTLNRHREKVTMKTDEPLYSLVREDYASTTVNEWPKTVVGLRDEIAALKKLVVEKNLEIHRLDSEKQTEACCTAEMRDSYEREIEGRHRLLRKALGPEWDSWDIEYAVAQLRRDHIASVQIADQVPELIRECNKLRADQFWYGGRESLEHAMRYESARAERLYKRTRLLADRLRMLGGFCHISSSKFAGQVLGGLYDEI